MLAEHAGEGERLIAYRAYLLGVNDCVNSEDLRELLLELQRDLSCEGADVQQ